MFCGGGRHCKVCAQTNRWGNGVIQQIVDTVLSDYSQHLLSVRIGETQMAVCKAFDRKLANGKLRKCTSWRLR